MYSCSILHRSKPCPASNLIPPTWPPSLHLKISLCNIWKLEWLHSPLFLFSCWPKSLYSNKAKALALASHPCRPWSSLLIYLDELHSEMKMERDSSLKGVSCSKSLDRNLLMGMDADFLAEIMETMENQCACDVWCIWMNLSSWDKVGAQPKMWTTGLHVNIAHDMSSSAMVDENGVPSCVVLLQCIWSISYQPILHYN